MMLNLNRETEPQKSVITKFAAVIAGGVFLVVLVGALRGTETMIVANEMNPEAGLIKNLGQVLYNQYLLPFEISSILFLTAMVGAVMLGKNELK
jgi:NADH-quinone oxidoreductase subunit J